MATRVNINTMANPDPYANIFGSMVPSGTVSSNNKLSPRKNLLDPNSIREESILQASLLKGKPVEAFKTEGFDTVKAAANVAFKADSAFKDANKLANSFNANKEAKAAGDIEGAKAAKSDMKMAGIGLGLNTAHIGAQLGGQKLKADAGINDKKKYQWGAALEGYGKDTLVTKGGSMLGSVAGTIIAGPAGAQVGGMIGEEAARIGQGIFHGVKGKKEFSKKVSDYNAEKAATEKYNAEIAENKRLLLGRGADQAKYAGLMNNAQMANQQSSNPYIWTAANGAKLIIPKFRRGGTVDLEKENVILAGPSHDDTNNTGVKGDKGLPVTYKDVKVAEIESLELVLNKKSSEKIEGLVKKYKETKDEKVLKDIAKITSNEITNNTYDYSKELLND